MQEENKQPFVQYLKKLNNPKEPDDYTYIRATSPDEAERLQNEVGYTPISKEEGRAEFEGKSGADEKTDISERKLLENTIKNFHSQK